MKPFTLALTPARQRVLALGLAFVIVAVVLGLIASFVAAQLEHHARVTLLVRERATRQALIDQASRWQGDLANLKAAPQWQRLYVPDASMGQQGPVAQHVIKYGGALTVSQVTRHDEGAAIEIQEEVRFGADIAALVHILHDLQSPEPDLVIRKLEIHDIESAGSGPRTNPNKLQVTMIVTGFAVSQ